MKNQAKKIIHQLYNSFTDDTNPAVEELKSVLLKVYQQLDTKKDPAPLVSRLLTYLYTDHFSQSFSFNSEQLQWIQELQAIAKTAGLNAPYRASITKDSF